MINATKLNSILTKLAGVCLLLAGSSGLGAFSAEKGVIIGIFGVICGSLASAPLLSPANGSNLWNRIFQTVAALAVAVSGSSLFPQVQHLFAAGTAAKIGVWVVLGGHVFGYLASSSAAAAPVVALLVGLMAFGASGCATVQPIVKDVEVCAGPDCADIATKILPAAEIILQCELATSGEALPLCASSGLASLAAGAGPDGWKIVNCVVSAIEKDMTKPPALRARAHAAHSMTAKKLAAMPVDAQ